MILVSKALSNNVQIAIATAYTGLLTPESIIEGLHTTKNGK